ncbi:hypothetical protein BC828DRAFT_409512, partial [Blastocladiella britannica]
MDPPIINSTMFEYKAPTGDPSVRSPLSPPLMSSIQRGSGSATAAAASSGCPMSAGSRQEQEGAGGCPVMHRQSTSSSGPGGSSATFINNNAGDGPGSGGDNGGSGAGDPVSEWRDTLDPGVRRMFENLRIDLDKMDGNIKQAENEIFRKEEEAFFARQDEIEHAQLIKRQQDELLRTEAQFRSMLEE